MFSYACEIVFICSDVCMFSYAGVLFSYTRAFFFSYTRGVCFSYAGVLCVRLQDNVVFICKFVLFFHIPGRFLFSYAS